MMVAIVAVCHAPHTALETLKLSISGQSIGFLLLLRFEKMKLVVSLLLLSFYIGLVQCAHEETGGGEATGSSVPVAPPCAMPQERLHVVLEELLIDGLELYINCLSFDKNASLVRGVISGVNRTNSSVGGERLELECTEGIIAGRPTLLPPSFERMNTSACLSCSDEGDRICQGECQSPCERCFQTAITCSRCIACEAEPSECTLQNSPMDSSKRLTHCQAECSNSQVVEAERFNACECPSDYYRELINPQPAPDEPAEEEGHTKCDFFPELEDFRCVKNCTFPGFNVNRELNICFACGVEYCLKCDRPTGHCLQCLENTQLYEDECFACPLATVAREAIVQEEELEEEERENSNRQLELAIALPIICVAVALFFFFMSVFAHYRYPHINPKGHKRHRVKPEDLVASGNFTSDADFDSNPTVWHSRPTVRYR